MKMDTNISALQEKLKIDCAKCSGLCCVALYCMKTDGFPGNKEAGIPCRHLAADFRCDIHRELKAKKMRGCLTYDCFGAGQKTTRLYAPGVDWQSTPKQADQIFRVFLTIFLLHQMEWYLIEALSLTGDKELQSDISALISESEQITAQQPQDILEFPIEAYQNHATRALKKVVKEISTAPSSIGKSKDFLGKNFKKANLAAADFSMALLISANLEGCNLKGTVFLGADLRDANIKNTDLSAAAFLTQMQINGAKGNRRTKLPKNLTYPLSWQED